MIPLISSITILIVNLITTDFLSKHKYNGWITYGLMIIFTGVVFFLTRLIIPSTNISIPQSFIFLFFSWIYLLLFMTIYTHSIKTLIIIMAFSLSHTILVNGFVYHLHDIIFNDTELFSMLYVQWIIFFMTTPLIILALKDTYKGIIHEIDQLKSISAILLPLIIFLVLFTLRFYLDFSQVSILLVFYAMMISMIILTYYIVYQVFKNNLSVNHLSKIAYKDSLTQIKNRQALYIDYLAICKDKKSCNFYYLDLDKLKTINDTHGHLDGDQYIIDFTKAVSKAHKNHGFYRISGDEFILIKEGLPIKDKVIETDIKKYFDSKHDFLGVSVGLVKYPNEAKSLDELLNIADQRMYDHKQSKNDYF